MKVREDSILETQPITSIDGGVQTIGLKADAAATDSTSPWSVIALLKGLWALLGPAPTASIFGASRRNTVGTLITVPAGKTFRGYAQVSGAINVGVNVAAVNGFVQITWTPSGTGFPATMTLVEAEISTPLIGLTALIGVANQNSASVYGIEINGGNSGGVVALAQSGLTTYFGTINGRLVN
jgi:hypothetical protein